MTTGNVTHLNRLNHYDFYKRLRFVENALRGVRHMAIHVPDHEGIHSVLHNLDDQLYSLMVELEQTLPDDCFNEFNPREYD